MASKILVWISAVVLVAVLFMAVFGASYIANPRFTVVNESPMSIVLVVGWDGQEHP
jgi:hypothetical protein